jgi:molecular chaperone GrpE
MDRPTDSRASSDQTEEADFAALRAENASLQDRLLRALADAENVRRRADRAAQDARNYAVADLSRELLTVLDNLRRAVAAAEDPAVESAGAAPLVEGIRAIERSLMTTLERFGIREIKARGTPFDPTRHEAIMEVNDPSRPPGSVADVMEEGYTIHDRLLRPAKVSVTLSRRDATDEQLASREDRRGSSANASE